VGRFGLGRFGFGPFWYRPDTALVVGTLAFVQGVRLAKKFETLVLSDRRFEVPAKRHLGMVVFRLKVGL